MISNESIPEKQASCYRFHRRLIVHKMTRLYTRAHLKIISSRCHKPWLGVLFSITIIMVIVNLLISVQLIRCDTSQQQQHQLLDTNRIKSTVRQLIKNTNNYLHSMKMANQQEKNTNQPGNYLLSSFQDNKLQNHPLPLQNSNTPDNSNQYTIKNDNSNETTQILHQTAPNHRLMLNEFNMNHAHNTPQTTAFELPKNHRLQQIDQNYTQQLLLSNNNSTIFADTNNKEQRRQQQQRKATITTLPNSTTDGNSNSSYSLNDIIQLAASNYIAMSSDGKPMNLNPPYESMSKQEQDVHITQPNHHFTITDSDDVEIIGVSNEPRMKTTNTNNNNQYNQYNTHANLSIGALDYINEPSSDQQVSSSDQRLDYHDIIDGSEHLMSETNNNHPESMPQTQTHNHHHHHHHAHDRRQYKMYDATSSDQINQYHQRNNNSRTYPHSALVTNQYTRPLYPILVRERKQSTNKQNYFNSNPMNNYRQSNYSQNQLPNGHPIRLREHQQQQQQQHQEQLSSEQLLANPASTQYESAGIGMNQGDNQNEQQSQVIEEDNSNGEQVVHQTSPSSAEQLGVGDNSENKLDESAHRDRITTQESTESSVSEEQEQVAPAQPTVGESPVVAPQLPIQYDSEIHMPPEGYYDDYYKPPLTASANNHNNHDNSFNNTNAIDENKYGSNNNMEGGNGSPLYHHNGSTNLSRSEHEEKRFEMPPHQQHGDVMNDQYKNHRYNNLRGIDSSNQNFPDQRQQNHEQQYSTNTNHHRFHQDGRANHTDRNQLKEMDHRYPKLEYYQNHAKMAAMSAVDQHYRNQMQPTMNILESDSNNYQHSGVKKNHIKRQQGFNNHPGLQTNFREPMAHQKFNRTNFELINDDGPLVFGINGMHSAASNESSSMVNQDAYEENHHPPGNSAYKFTRGESRHNERPERYHDENRYDLPSKPNNQEQPYVWSSTGPDTDTPDTPPMERENAPQSASGKRNSGKGNFSVIDYDGTGYRRPGKTGNQSTTRPNNYDNEQHQLKNLILSSPTSEPTVTSTIGTLKKLKEMKPQPDRNELMNELLTALDKVKMAIYKLQPLTAKVNAMYRKSVTSNTRDIVMDNNKGTYARRYPPGDYDDSYDRIPLSEKLSTGDSVPNVVYVPAPTDVLEAYMNNTKKEKITSASFNNSTVGNKTVDPPIKDHLNYLPSNVQRISDRMLTNVEMHASESTDHVPTIVATGVGRRLEDGQVTGELEVTSGGLRISQSKKENSMNIPMSARSSIPLNDSAAPDFVPEDQLNNNEPLFGYRITIYQSPEDYEVPRIKEIDPRMDEEQNNEESEDSPLERRSDTDSEDDDYMATSESSIIEHEVQADASETKKKYESGGEGNMEEKESGKEGKKGGKKSGKMKKGESKKKKHQAEAKKKKEYKKIKQNKGILSKEKKSMHRDKHIAAHDRGAAKEKALKERTQIEFFEREQIVDDEYEKGKKSLMKAGWQTGAESKKAIKVSDNTEKPVSYESKDGSKGGKHSSYEKGHENKMGRANMHSSNKYEKKNMENKGKKFKGWREKGYKIITETEFIDRGSLHDSAYKKRDKGAAHHKKYKKQEASSEGHHGTIEESSKKKSGHQEKKFNSKEHDSKKHKKKESHKKKKKKKKKEFENEFEKDHDHEESVMTATVTPRGFQNETGYETTLKPIYYPRDNQSMTLNRLISYGDTDRILNLMNDPGVRHQRLNDTTISQNGRADNNKQSTTNISIGFAGPRPSLPLNNYSKSILSSLQAILARQNSEIDIVDNSTGKHMNKTKLGVYKLEDSHVVKLANLGHNNNNSSSVGPNVHQNNNYEQTTRSPRNDSNNHETTTTALPLLNTEIIPMNEPASPQRPNTRGNNKNHQKDVSSINAVKQQLLFQGQPKQESSMKPEMNQQSPHSNTGKMNTRGPLDNLVQNNQVYNNQQLNRASPVQQRLPINMEPSSMFMGVQPDGNQENLNNHQNKLPVLYEQHQPVMSHFEQQFLQQQQQQPANFLSTPEFESHRNNFPPRLSPPPNQQQYPLAQPVNINHQVNRNHPEKQLFAQMNDQLVHSIRHSESAFGKSMTVQPYPPQISSVIHEQNLPLIDYDQDHTSVFPSSGYYLSDVM